MKISGTVASGLGQGAQFLALDWVSRELRRKLGLTPFPGTLNLHVAPGERAALFARRHQFTRIADSTSSDCPGYVTKATLRAHGKLAEAYLVIPEKSHYTDVVEFIAGDHLRESLSLDDGVVVEIEMA